MTVVIEQVETRCPHEGCSWTFVGTALRGKAAVPQHLAIVHGGRRPGEPAAGRAALDAMDAGEPQSPEPEAPEPEERPSVDTAPESVEEGARRSPGTWNRETVTAAIQAFAVEHGRTPTQKSAAALVSAAKNVFGSWGDAVVAAGFERPRRGQTNRIDAGVAQPDRAPADQADDAGSTPAPRSDESHDVEVDIEADANTAQKAENASTERPSAPRERDITEDAQINLASRSDDAADEPGGALDLATLTDGDADSWITRCDREAERCTEEAARLVRRAKGFETIGDGLRVLRETSA